MAIDMKVNDTRIDDKRVSEMLNEMGRIGGTERSFEIMSPWQKVVYCMNELVTKTINNLSKNSGYSINYASGGGAKVEDNSRHTHHNTFNITINLDGETLARFTKNEEVIDV